MKTQEEKNIQAEKAEVLNKSDECLTDDNVCVYLHYFSSRIDNSPIYVCCKYREVLNGCIIPVRAEICFDTFGIARENNTAPAPENESCDNEGDLPIYTNDGDYIRRKTIPPANKTE